MLAFDFCVSKLLTDLTQSEAIISVVVFSSFFWGSEFLSQPPVPVPSSQYQYHLYILDHLSELIAKRMEVPDSACILSMVDIVGPGSSCSSYICRSVLKDGVKTH